MQLNKIVKYALVLVQNPGLRNEIVGKLRSININVMKATGLGSAGIEELEQNTHRCDLIILDIRLTDMSGAAFLKSIRSNPKYNKTHVMALYLDDEVSQLLDMFSLGVSGYMKKPFNRDQLVNTIKVRMGRYLLFKGNIKALYHDCAASLFELLQEFEYALDQYKEVCKNIECAQSHFDLGRLYIKAGEFEKAKVEFNKCVKLDVKFAKLIKRFIVQTKKQPGRVVVDKTKLSATAIKIFHEPEMKFINNAFQMSQLKRALVVGGSYNERMSLKTALQQLGITSTVMATSGDEALEILSGQAFDLLLVNLKLSDMNGLQFVHAIRKNMNIFSLIVYLLEEELQENMKKGFELEVDGFIFKPFTTNDVCARIHTVLLQDHMTTMIREGSARLKASYFFQLLGKAKESLESALTALQHRPNDGVALFYVAMAYHINAEVVKAKDYYDKAQELQPELKELCEQSFKIYEELRKRQLLKQQLEEENDHVDADANADADSPELDDDFVEPFRKGEYDEDFAEKKSVEFYTSQIQDINHEEQEQDQEVQPDVSPLSFEYDDADTIDTREVEDAADPNTGESESVWDMMDDVDTSDLGSLQNGDEKNHLKITQISDDVTAFHWGDDDQEDFHAESSSPFTDEPQIENIELMEEYPDDDRISLSYLETISGLNSHQRPNHSNSPIESSVQDLSRFNLKKYVDPSVSEEQLLEAANNINFGVSTAHYPLANPIEQVFTHKGVDYDVGNNHVVRLIGTEITEWMPDAKFNKFVNDFSFEGPEVFGFRNGDIADLNKDVSNDIEKLNTSEEFKKLAASADILMNQARLFDSRISAEEKLKNQEDSIDIRNYLESVGRALSHQDVLAILDETDQSIKSSLNRVIKKAQENDDGHLYEEIGRAMIADGHLDTIFTQMEDEFSGYLKGLDGKGAMIEGDKERIIPLLNTIQTIKKPTVKLHRKYYKAKEKFNNMLPYFMKEYEKGEEDVFTPLYRAMEVDHHSFASFKKIYSQLKKDKGGNTANQYMYKIKHFYMDHKKTRDNIIKFLIAMGEKEEAKKMLMASLKYKEDKNNIFHLRSLALLSYQAKSYKETIKWCKRILKYYKNDIEAFNMYGASLKKLDKVKQAVKIYRKGLVAHPYSYKMRHNLAIALANIGKNDEAKEEFEKAKELKKTEAEKIAISPLEDESAEDNFPIRLSS